MKVLKIDDLVVYQDNLGKVLDIDGNSVEVLWHFGTINESITVEDYDKLEKVNTSI